MKSKFFRTFASFTIPEITVAMIISGIAVTIAYISLDLLTKSYIKFRENQTFVTKVSTWRNELNKDLLRSDLAISSINGFELRQNNNLISTYTKGENYFVKVSKGQNDTLFLENPELELFFTISNTEIIEEGKLLDLIYLSGFRHNEIWNLCARKTYSASALIKAEKTKLLSQWQ